MISPNPVGLGPLGAQFLGAGVICAGFAVWAYAGSGDHRTCRCDGPAGLGWIHCGRPRSVPVRYPRTRSGHSQRPLPQPW